MTDEVTHLQPARLRGGRFGPSDRLRPVPGRMRRALRGMLVAKMLVAAAIGVAAGMLYLRLDAAPLRLDFLSHRIEAALAERLGPRLGVSLEDTALTLHEGTIALSITGLDLRDADGALVARAPHAVVGVGALSLLTGRPSLRSIALRDVDLRARIARDGSLSLVPAAELAATPDAAPAEPGGRAGEEAPDEPATIAAVAAAALADPDIGTRSGAFVAALVDPESPIGGLASARLEGARLTLVDESGRERAALGRVDARIWTVRGARNVEARIASPRGMWTLRGAVAASGAGALSVELALAGLPAYDLALMTGVSQRIGGEGLLLDGSARLAIDTEGAVRSLAVSLAGGPGHLTTRDPFMPRVPLDEAAFEAEWLPRERRVTIERLAVAGGETRVALSGHARALDEPGVWQIALSGRDARVRAAAAGEPPVRLDTVAIAGSAGPDGIVIDEAQVRAPGIDVDLRLSVGGEADRGGVRVGVSTRDIAARTALALWPDFVAPLPRLFLRDALRSGRVRALDVEVAITGEGFASLTAEQGLAPEALAIDFAIDDGVLALDPRFPALSGVAVTGRVDGRSLELSASAAEIVQPGRSTIALGAGRMRIPEFWTPQARVEMAFEATGGLDALAALLRTPTLEAASALAHGPDDVSGRARLGVAFSFPLDTPFRPQDLPITAQGRLTEVALARIVGEESLEEGALDVTIRPDGLVEVEGGARIGGYPARIALSFPRHGGEGEARVALEVDAASLAARGFLPPGRIEGTIPVDIVAAIGRSDPTGARIEADLGAARIAEAVPGFTKPAGVPGRLVARLESDDAGLALEEIALEAGSAVMRGRGRLAADGALESLDLETLRLSPGDDARLSLVRENGTTRARLRGRTLDVRPLLAGLADFGGAGGNGGANGGVAEPLEIDAAIDILTGHRGEVITSATMSARVIGNALRRLDLAGRFPDAPLGARLGPEGLIAESADAGATLRFLGLYDNLIGGRLLLQAGPVAARQEGLLILHEFSLRDEPALRRIAGSARVSDGRGGTVDISEVLFAKAQADFVREGGLITLGDVRMWGAQLGFTLSGWVDLAREQIDIAGAFVPAYGLNNAFAQVPIIGRILGGNRYEGLLAVNFRVAGPTAEPLLTVNPLSAIAPGVLRGLFGTGAPSLPAAPDLGAPPLAPPLQITPLR